MKSFFAFICLLYTPFVFIQKATEKNTLNAMLNGKEYQAEPQRSKEVKF